MHLAASGTTNPSVRPSQVQKTASCALCRRARSQLRRCAPAERRTTVAPRASGANGVSDSTDVEPTTLRVNLSAFPDVDFFKVEVIHELSANGILGMTATNVLGTRERYKGTEHGLANLVEKSKLEVVCFRTQVNRVVRTITSAAGTGYVGDGKIFVSPVADIIRIRTQETGTNADRMEGGMSDSNILTTHDSE